MPNVFVNAQQERRFEKHERGNGLLLLFHLLSLLTLTFNAIEPANHHSLFIILFHYIYLFSIKFLIYGLYSSRVMKIYLCEEIDRFID